MAKHPDHRRVKLHYTYTVEELASITHVHVNTVRAWRSAGLSPVDESRPALFKGGTVIGFLKRRKAAGKHQCGSGEMFCLPCRKVRRPAGDMADYIPITQTSGNLAGICPGCDRLMHRRTSLARLRLAAGNLDITITHAAPRLKDTSQPSVNSDFEMIKETT